MRASQISASLPPLVSRAAKECGRNGRQSLNVFKKDMEVPDDVNEPMDTGVFNGDDNVEENGGWFEF